MSTGVVGADMPGIYHVTSSSYDRRRSLDAEHLTQATTQKLSALHMGEDPRDTMELEVLHAWLCKPYGC